MHEQPSKEDAVKIKRQFRLISAAAVLMLGVGTIAMHYLEKLPWTDSFYFSVVSLTTVGYGDITPSTSSGKLFVAMYLLVGIGIIAAFASTLLRNVVVQRVIKKNKKN